MRRNRLITILAALLVALLSLPAFAHASGEDVIRDCNEDGTLDGNYSQEELRDAEQNLPSDIDQYGDCRDVINQAQADGSRNNSSNGGGGGSNSGGTGGESRRGGSAKPTQGNPAFETDSGAYANNQEDKSAYDKAVADATRGGALPGGLAIPAAGDFKPANSDGLPLPVLLALVSIGLLIAVTTVMVARKRLPLPSRVTSRFRRS